MWLDYSAKFTKKVGAIDAFGVLRYYKLTTYEEVRI